MHSRRADKEKAPSEELKAKHSNRYWTSGKIFCGLCGERYVSLRKKQKNIPYKAWVCVENNQRGQYKQLVLDTGEITYVGCNALRVNDRVLKTAVFDIITQIVKPHKQALIDEMRTELIKVQKPQDNSKQIAKIEKQIAEIDEELDMLTLQLTKKRITEERYERVAKMQEKELADLRSKLAELQMDNSALDAESYINACIAELEKIVNLADDEINEGLYERITKKIVVYPLNIIEIHLSFMTTPIRLQFSTSGRCEAYKVEFTILKQEEFDELMKNAPHNELPSKNE